MSIEKGKEVVRIEAEAVRQLENKINDQFQKAISILLACNRDG